jgi:O-antigen ligase
MFSQLIVTALLFPLVGSHRRRTSQLSRIARSLPVRLALLVVLVVALAFGALWLGGDRLITKLAQGTAEYDPATSEMRQGGYRNQMWKATWQMFLAHPITGVGMGGYWAAIPTYHDASGTLTPQEAHNDYLELLASGGLVGMAIGVWFTVLLLRRIRANLQSHDRFRRVAAYAASIGIAGVAVHNLFDFGLHLTVNALVFTVLLVIATCRMRKESRAVFHA